MGTTRASCPISRGRVRARHVGYDAPRSCYAARRGAGLFPPRQRRYRIEVYPNNPGPHRRYRMSVTAAAQGRSSWWTAPAQSTFFTRCRSSAIVMFCPHPDVCCGGANIVSGLIMLVKDKGADIAFLRTMGATQGAACACSSLRRRHRRWSARWSASVGLLYASTSSRSASSSPGDQHQLFRGAILPVEAAGRGRVGETAAVVIMALTLSFWRRSITSWRARARSFGRAAVRVSGRWSGGQRGSGGFLARDPRPLPQGEATLTSSSARRALWEGQSWRWWRRLRHRQIDRDDIEGCSSIPTWARYMRRHRTSGLSDAEARGSGATEFGFVYRRPAAAGILGARDVIAAADDPRPARKETIKRSQKSSPISARARVSHRRADLSGGVRSSVWRCKARGRQRPRVLLATSDRQLDPHTRPWFHCDDQLCGRRVAMLIATNNMELAGRMVRPGSRFRTATSSSSTDVSAAAAAQ